MFIYILIRKNPMNIRDINSLEELKRKISEEVRSFLLIYKEGSVSSDTALNNIMLATPDITDIKLFTVNVNKVRDVHPAYSITSAPTLLEFEKGDVRNTIKGAHDADFYKALFENALYIATAEKEGKPVKSVTVYSTPTCSWCNTLKIYLKKNGIRFTDIDVSRDEVSAQEMVRRSGQQGVPQTIINGEIVIGFDKPKINRLLEISN
jgi:glutaredoxin-like YruB-family protein